MIESLKILVLYHYFHPDDVVSAIQKKVLAEDMARRGYAVEVWPSNRSCHHKNDVYTTIPETINGVLVRRVWRPGFKQHKFIGRILNTIWMAAAWKLRILFSRKNYDVVVIGTDPIFAFAIAPLIRWKWPKCRIVQWCFDMYPEYAEAEGIIRENGWIATIIRWFLKWPYRVHDLVVNIGPCMRERLSRYPIKAHTTITPWALEEPADPLPIDPIEREALFGSSPLALLYSGNFGRPHEYRLTLALARHLRHAANPTKRGQASQFTISATPTLVYSARGSKLSELKTAVTPEDTNVRFVDFAPPDRLAARLASPDIHVVSLSPSYTGAVVPSKFFGALAAGRPVLFEGSVDCSIARWIKEHKVGWILPSRAEGDAHSAPFSRSGRGDWDAAELGVDDEERKAIEEVGMDLLVFAADPARKEAMFRHCHEVYQKHFSKRVMLERWRQAIQAPNAG